mmetsp:Transcript_3103/g.6740  ORF Transcript_3103/g.6740 Transcript_3103/m.6740 type:complete len:234 (-) Transcript_3103:88-789(-)
MAAPEILISCFRAIGRYFAMAALILQIVGTWGCDLLSKQPYGISASFHNHGDVLDATGNRCAAFGTAGIALSGTDATFNFAKWMTYLAIIFGLVAVFSDCAILRICPCKEVRRRYVQTAYVGCIQLVVCVMLGLCFTVLDSRFCRAEWLDTEGVPLPNDSGDDLYSCTLHWGGVCVAVAVALWAAAGGMTLGKAFSDKADQERKEQDEADAAARKKKEEEAAAASNRQMDEVI